LDSKEFKTFRKKLGKTQRETSQLLGTSIKAIHSYEQGWRKIPTHAERHMFFLVTRLFQKPKRPSPCWITKACPDDFRTNCPAWEFHTGDLCWFINGTICGGVAHENWREKMKSCRKCKVLKSQLS
jgi:DNA-binding XRE family transcriptional regulator